MTFFFVPEVSESEKAERVYDGIRKFVSGQVGPLTERRIYRIRFRHDGRRFDLRVGDAHPELGETIMAILEDHCYYICTFSRGVLLGEPQAVPRTSVSFVEEFVAGPASEHVAASYAQR